MFPDRSLSTEKRSECIDREVFSEEAELNVKMKKPGTPLNRSAFCCFGQIDGRLIDTSVSLFYLNFGVH
jgi:hypothetical protein